MVILRFIEWLLYYKTIKFVEFTLFSHQDILEVQTHQREGGVFVSIWEEWESNPR